MRRVERWLTAAYRVLFVGMAPALYLSYFPVIRLGSDATMNLELSVAEIWLVALGMAGGLLLMVRGEMVGVMRRWLRRRWAWGFFPLMVTASAVWSANAARGWLTVLMMWAVIVAVVVIWELRGVMDEKWRRYWWRGVVGGTVVACAWCVTQCVLDVAGVAREVTGMCAGCVSGMFGFPHPNGWAIEPQFMGNLLLAPAIMVMARSLRAGLPLGAFAQPVATGGRRYSSLCQAPDPIRERLCRLLLFGIIAATIFLTFSRGAIYAFLIGVFAIAIYYVMRWKAWRGVMVVWGIVIAAFVLVLNLQGIMAELGPTDDTYMTAVTKVINHLTLGVVDLRGGEARKNETGEEEMGVGSEEKADSSPSLSEAVGEAKNEAVFDGYVAESTETRVRLNDAALAVWASNPAVVVAGVGIGGAGVALYEAGLTAAPKEIVQNEYISLLLETGVVGVILAAVMVISVMIILIRRRAVTILVLMLTYGVTLMFFSGLPNALHIYLMPVLMLAGANTYKGKRKKLVS